MIKNIITDISEEDFRKLDITLFTHSVVELDKGFRYVVKEIHANDVLDETINAMLEDGYESDLTDLSIPITLAIHEDPKEDVYEEIRKEYPALDETAVDAIAKATCFYFDKFMNHFTAPRNYQIAEGIKHLYSTRDYYEDREDYWRVRKADTKVIYRIRLKDSWKDKFVLKHKVEVKPWDRNILPDNVSPDYISAVIKTWYDLVDGKWVKSSSVAEFKYERSTYVVPLKED